MPEIPSTENNAPVVSLTELWTVIEKGGTGKLGIQTSQFGAMLVSIDTDIIRALRGELTIVESLLQARPQSRPAMDQDR
jgi:hypothetical protein